LVPPSLPGHSPGIGLKFDPQKARQLLAEAGYPDGAGLPDMAIVAKDTPAFQLCVEILVRQWREVLGVEVETIFMPLGPEPDVKNSIKEGQKIALFGVIPDYPDSDWYLRCLVDDFVRAPTGWPDVTYDQLLQSARLEHDQHRRQEYYHQMDKLIIKQAIVAPLYYTVAPTIIKPWVKQPFFDFAYQLWKNVVIEPH
jgi:oligopeptide transport system substrate-binding protein